MSKAATPALTIALLLAGCSNLPAPDAPAQAAIETMPKPELGPALGGRPVSLPPLNERLAHLALQEWTLWGQVRWLLSEDKLERPRGEQAAPTEDLAPFTSRVLHYWFALQGRDFAAAPQRYADGSLLPWSAVFISYLAKTAGMTSEQFPPSSTHWGYIRASLEQPRRAKLQALDAGSTPPALGDLICAPREAAARQFQSFAQLQALSRRERERFWPFHCDLVVALGMGSLGAIGGNVHERVLWTEVALDARGLLRPHPERPWLLLLRPSGPGS